MINIKFRLKISKFKNDLRNGYYFLMKPLAKCIRKRDDRKYDRKQEKVKKVVNQLTDKEVIEIIVKNIVKEVIKSHQFYKNFNYEHSYECNNDILTYVERMENKIPYEWCHSQIKTYQDNQLLINRLMPLLETELNKYSENILSEVRQKDGYSYTKVLIVGLKEFSS